jgi:hypothetical protein
MKESKSILAKLLASEDILVTHSKSASTAYFDLKNRELVCPTLKEMTGDIYDLFIGHEVSHALNTPPDGWHNAVNNDREFKTILNVVEDSRIERMIKVKYPGLKRSFSNAYKKLAEDDFFGINKLKDLNFLNLIDRINLREKTGFTYFINFNEKESELLSLVQTTETWEDVVKVSTLIAEYIQENEQDKISSVEELAASTSEEPSSADDDEGEGEGDDEGNTESYQSSNVSEKSDDDNDNEDENYQNHNVQGETAESENSSQENPSDQKDTVPQSVTDKIFRNNESKLLDSGSNTSVCTLPKDVYLENIIVNNATFLREYEKYIIKTINIHNSSGVYQEFAKDRDKEFNNQNKKYITMLLKEFEMRKRAGEYSRSAEGKTGILDTKKIANYKFNTDIFKKINVTSNGKNHGIVMVVDFSASMIGSNLRFALEQALCLASFCKKANIAFDVYSFTTGSAAASVRGKTAAHRVSPQPTYDVSNQFSDNSRTDQIVFTRNLKMTNLISSNMSSSDYAKSFSYLTYYAKYHSNKNARYLPIDEAVKYIDRACIPPSLNMSNTPYIEMVYATRKIANEFKEKNNIQIMNVIVLSDGIGNSEMSFRERANNYIIVDPLTGNKLKMSDEYYYTVNHQKTICELIFGNMDANVIGYYVENSSNGIRKTVSSLDISTQYENIKREINKNGFCQISMKGFDEYYLVKDESFCDSTNKVKNNINNKTKRELMKEFRQDIKSSVNKRMIVSKLCKNIA